MSVHRALTTAGISFRVHDHPPIRTEADLPLTGLDLDRSVRTLAFETPDGSADSTLELDVDDLLRVAARSLVAPLAQPQDR